MAAQDTWAFMMGTTNYTLAFDYDGNGNQIYIGWAQPGTAQSATGWRIMRQTFNASGNQITADWPSASTAFNFIWDNRAGYSYS